MVGDVAAGGDRGKVDGEEDDDHGMVADDEDSAAVELEVVELS